MRPDFAVILSSSLGCNLLHMNYNFNQTASSHGYNFLFLLIRPAIMSRIFACNLAKYNQAAYLPLISRFKIYV